MKKFTLSLLTVAVFVVGSFVTLNAKSTSHAQPVQAKSIAFGERAEANPAIQCYWKGGYHFCMASDGTLF